MSNPLDSGKVLFFFLTFFIAFLHDYTIQSQQEAGHHPLYLPQRKGVEKLWMKKGDSQQKGKFKKKIGNFRE